MHAVSARRFSAFGRDGVNVPYEQMTPEGKLAFLQSQLGGIATVLRQAIARGDQTLEAYMRTKYREFSGRLAALRVEASRRDMPSAFMRTLDAFSDRVLAIGREAGALAGAAAKGLGGVLKNLPFFLLAALVVVGIGAAGYARRRIP